MPDRVVNVFAADELRAFLQDELERNPFRAEARWAQTTRIADGTAVRLPGGDDGIRGTVVECRADGDYLVRVPDGREVVFAGPELERRNPGAPRVPRQ